MSGLEQLLEKTVGGMGYELADFEYAGRGRMLRVFIDKQVEGAKAANASSRGMTVTLDDCEAVTRQLQRVLPVEGIDYDRLEVSSPGLDRRLRKAADFVRFTGCEAQVRLRLPVEGRRNFTGVVHGVEGDRIELEFDGGRMAFELANLDRARLVPKL